MSRTKKVKTGATSPIAVYIDYKPNSGVFRVYNKNTKQTEEVEKLEMIILDAERFKIIGFHPDYGTSLICNPVFSSKHEPFEVGVFVSGAYKLLAKGLYQDIKNSLPDPKYAKMVVGLVNLNGKWEVAEIDLISSGKKFFDEWATENAETKHDYVIELSCSADMFKYDKVKDEIQKIPKEKWKKSKLSTWFHKLVIKNVSELDDELIELADDADSTLQAYLPPHPDNVNSNGKPVSTSTEAIIEEDFDDDEDEDDDLPF